MSGTQECVDCQPGPAAAVQQAVDTPGKETVPEVKNEAATDPLNPAAFIPPMPLPTPNITIEFCDRVSLL